jgi:hypothetical protein
MSYLPEGPGWGKVVGRYWVRDGKAYFPDGDIVDATKRPPLFTHLLGNASHDEDYSKWTPEQCAEWRRQNPYTI